MKNQNKELEQQEAAAALYIIGKMHTFVPCE